MIDLEGTCSECVEGIGSPSQTKGVLRPGDTGKVIDSEWLTQTRTVTISGSADSPMAARHAPETRNNVPTSR